MKQLLLSDREATALDAALELFIRLGLGQFSEMAKQLSVLMEKRGVPFEELQSISDISLGEGWTLQDSETHSMTIAAFGIQAKLGENHGAWEWACKRLHDNGDLE